MTYLYGMQSFPAIGGGLGGLPRRKEAVVVKSDPHFSNVSLLLHGSELVDSSSSPKIITAYGNAAVSTAQSKFGSSIYFDGMGDYLQVSTISLASDFTVEFFVRRVAESYQIILSGSNDTQIAIGSVSAGVSASVYSPSAQALMGTTGKVPINTWVHVAACRSGTVLRIFIDGVLDVSLSSSTNTFLIDYVSKYGVGSGYNLNGYIDELRITNGVARYTTDFTPPTEPFLDQ